MRPWVIAGIIIVVAVIAVSLIGTGVYLFPGAGTPGITAKTMARGLTTPTTAPASTLPLTTVRAGYLPDVLVSAPFIAALERGYFEQEGLRVELTKFASSKDMHDALVSGRLDFTALDGFPNLFASEAISPGKVKVTGYAADTDQRYMTYFIVRRDSPMTNVSELKGKRFAAPLGTNGKVWAEAMLHGFGVDSFELVQMKYELMLPALQAGQVDAVWANEPLRALGESKGVSRVLEAHPRRVVLNPAPYVAMLAFNTDFLNSNPEAARKIARAQAKAIDDLHANQTEVKRLYAKHTGLELSIALASTLPYMSAQASEADLRQVQALADFLYANGELKKPIEVTGLYWKDTGQKG